MTCTECDDRSHCKKPYRDLRKELRAVGGRYYEKYLTQDVVIYPQKHHVQYDMRENKDNFSNDNQVTWLTGDFKLRMTNVFVEHFFRKKSFEEIADKYDVTASAVETHYYNAVHQIEQLLRAMDSRKEGDKHSLRSERGYTDAQKYFLLSKIFGFSGSEVARMFKAPTTTVNRRIREMTAQFAFKEPVRKSAYDGLTYEQIKERMGY